MTDTLFHATTLKTSELSLTGPIVDRKRILDIIDSSLGSGVVTWIVGPIGSGKSTVARQWAAGRNSDIQLISVRPEKHGVQEHLGPPSPFGAAFANLLNLCSLDNRTATKAEIASALDLVVACSVEERQSFILDDLELIRRNSLSMLQALFVDALPKLHIEHGMFISRTLDSHILGTLQAQSVLRMILPSTLEFDLRETTEAHQAGVFGSAPLEEVRAARERSAGWISGMLTELHGHGGSTIERATFDTYILNDMLLYQPPLILRCMCASTMLPYTTTDIWERWFKELNIPNWAIPAIFSQLPTKTLEGAAGRTAVVPAMANVLRSHSDITILDEDIQELLLLAMDWYIGNDDAKNAVQVAVDHDLEYEYLQIIRPIVRKLAREEAWQEIGKLVEGISVTAIARDADISFWYGFALTGENRWSDMLDIHYRTSEDWSNSDNELTRGRYQLLKGFIARANGNYSEALESFEQAYNTLPPTDHQERMYAAASAGSTQSQIRLGTNVVKWRRHTAFELAHLPPEQRWWHGNIGPITLGYVASSGQVDQALKQATEQVAVLNNISPKLSWRYVLLLANIAIERLQFDKAKEYLTTAQSLVETPLQIKMLTQGESALLAAKGEYKLAASKLKLQLFSAGRSVNNEFIVKLRRASQAFDSGDSYTAAFLLETAAWPVDAWPRNFGDTHPNLILAMIRAETSSIDEALALANEVLHEAEYRRNRYIQIRSHVVLAYIHQLSNNVAARDREIQTAIDLNEHANYQLQFFVRGQDFRTLATTSNHTHDIPPRNSHNELTSREAQVLKLVSQSLSNKQIADEMYISVSTVKNHLSSVYDKLGTNNRRAAVRIAQQLSLIP